MELTEQERQQLVEAENAAIQAQFKNHINEYKARQEAELRQQEALKASFM